MRCAQWFTIYEVQYACLLQQVYQQPAIETTCLASQLLHCARVQACSLWIPPLRLAPSQL
eukprot:364829-Chlamydomonas_euryale.AAC.2